MDSIEDGGCVRKSYKLNSDDDISRNCKGASKQRGLNENSENVRPVSDSISNDTNCVPPNDSHSRRLICSSSGEPGPSGRLVAGSEECCNKNIASSQAVGARVNNSYLEVAGSSKAETIARDNGIPSTQELQTCQRHKVCQEKAGNTYNLNFPSTSATSRVCDNFFDNAGLRENRKRPSSLKLNRPNLDADDSSSDTGNDDYSLGSEDGCIYTYRGGEHLADLPSSFFSLDMGLPLDRHLPIHPLYQQQPAGANAREHGSRASSPEMDFLEMDFDPGPSCEVDTGDESTPDADLDVAVNMPEENEPVLREPTPEFVPLRNAEPSRPVSSTSQCPEPSTHNYSMPSTSRGIPTAHSSTREDSGNNYTFGPYITHVNFKGEQLKVRRTMARGPCILPVSLHLTNGDLITPREVLHHDEKMEEEEAPLAHQINQGEGTGIDPVNVSTALFHMTMAKKLMLEKNRSDEETEGSVVSGEGPSCLGVTEPPTSMVWSEREACERQVTQIGVSACGATAVVNVFIALGVPVNIEKINTAVGTRQRANNAPIPRYLLSRSVAGCTAADLVNGIQKASEGLVAARFFPMYPERAVSLSHWLADWISIGAVPILTMNLQVGCEGEIPDAWHHQMVFGVSPRGIYLSNPVECTRECALWPKLTSPSVLLVRTRDVLARFTPDTDLTPLMAVPDRRFNTFNVLGQVVNVIREWRLAGWAAHGPRTRYVRLPAAYQAGVTVAALTGSQAHKRLTTAAQLPILAPHVEKFGVG
ncbi:uncharacterized protein LOC134798170 [Cydia splendana]|uniref:uncharacterized protein LOC134798170 n=1 Tax=Cydia splendana TaxID=1100963 RepID=UPI00300C74A2